MKEALELSHHKQQVNFISLAHINVWTQMEMGSQQIVTSGLVDGVLEHPQFIFILNQLTQGV